MRENYFQTADEQNYLAYRNEFTLINQQATDIDALPLLGIINKNDAINEDEFTLGDPAPSVDLAEEIKSELRNLSRRCGCRITSYLPNYENFIFFNLLF